MRHPLRHGFVVIFSTIRLKFWCALYDVDDLLSPGLQNSCNAARWGMKEKRMVWLTPWHVAYIHFTVRNVVGMVLNVCDVCWCAWHWRISTKKKGATSSPTPSCSSTTYRRSLSCPLTAAQDVVIFAFTFTEEKTNLFLSSKSWGKLRSRLTFSPNLLIAPIIVPSILRDTREEITCRVSNAVEASRLFIEIFYMYEVDLSSCSNQCQYVGINSLLYCGFEQIMWNFLIKFYGMYNIALRVLALLQWIAQPTLSTGPDTTSSSVDPTLRIWRLKYSITNIVHCRAAAIGIRISGKISNQKERRKGKAT